MTAAEPTSGPAIEVTVDGVAVRAPAGQTVAAVLMRGDRPAWRRTRRLGEWRGVSCGIGVCFDCLVTLNGTPGVRACLVEARDGDDIRSEQGSGFADDAV